jgi:hypothetical protein
MVAAAVDARIGDAAVGAEYVVHLRLADAGLVPGNDECAAVANTSRCREEVRTGGRRGCHRPHQRADTATASVRRSLRIPAFLPSGTRICTCPTIALTREEASRVERSGN